MERDIPDLLTCSTLVQTVSFLWSRTFLKSSRSSLIAWVFLIIRWFLLAEGFKVLTDCALRLLQAAEWADIAVSVLVCGGVFGEVVECAVRLWPERVLLAA